jgi:DNA polymerase III subunit epsilon
MSLLRCCRDESHEPFLSRCLMREIVIDIETTGLDPLGGHRVVEIGAVELVNRSLTGQTFHRYLCPQRAMPADAVAVHGLTAEFLADKPLFGAVADEFLEFVGEAPLVAHNAAFDIAFPNDERKRAAKPPIAIERVIDTLVLARRKHAGGHNTLDDLCSRYGGVNSLRSKHGALLDAELLAAVYVELISDRQAAMQFEPLVSGTSNVRAIVRVRPKPLPPRVTTEDRNAHSEFVRTLGSNAV